MLFISIREWNNEDLGGMKNEIDKRTDHIYENALRLCPYRACLGPERFSDRLSEGVLDGLGVGWEMAKKHDQALQGRPEEFNLAVPIYNAWIEKIFGRNESLMLLPVSSATAGQAARQKDSYFISKTFTPYTPWMPAGTRRRSPCCPSRMLTALSMVFLPMPTTPSAPPWRTFNE